MARSSRTVLLSCVLLFSMCVQSLAQDCSSYSFSSNKNFDSCISLPVLSSHLHWTFYSLNNTVDIAFRRTGATPSNWIAWGLNPSSAKMVGSQALMAYQLSNGTMRAYTTDVESTSPSMQPGSISFGVPNISAMYTNGDMIIFATLQLNSNLLSTNQVWQEGTVRGDSPTPHAMNSENMQSVGTINFQSGAATGGGNSKIHRKNVHGVLNAVSWGILMPIGIIIARYLKVSETAGAAWFYLHVACQSSAYVIGVAGWATGIKLGKDSPGITYHKHRNIGITLFCLGTLQVKSLHFYQTSVIFMANYFLTDCWGLAVLLKKQIINYKAKS
uniref:Uncharacterized protein MANES_S070200 n=1 Tax=Rhizophora mucronata TaxID=61149 RepID=A0A2P2JLG2_RHIMU